MDFARSFGLDHFCSYSHRLNACKGWELIIHYSISYRVSLTTETANQNFTK